MDDRLSIEPPRYDVLEGPGVSTLNRLLQCSASQGANSADLTLRDLQDGRTIHTTIVEVQLEHDPVGGLVFFTGTLDTGFRINGHVRPTAGSNRVVGSAHIHL